jgi:hypothetical protein
MSRHLLLALLFVFTASACGDGLLPVDAEPAPVFRGKVAGRVVSTLEGIPIPRATIRLRGGATLADDAGHFSLVGIQGSEIADAITVYAPGYLERAFRVPRSRDDLVIDLIPYRTPFSLDFYRQFARNGAESPNSLQQLRRWTMAPSFYIKTTLQVTGEEVPADLIQRIRTVLENSVVELSGGQFRAAAIETGAAARNTRLGWVNVVFERDMQGSAIGRATVGGNIGTITLEYDPDTPFLTPDDPRGCASRLIFVAEHEVTHTMGFWHTANNSEAFNSTIGSGCTGASRAANARYHASIVYARHPGNLDVDVDPPEAYSVQSPLEAAPAAVSCGVADIYK